MLGGICKILLPLYTIYVAALTLIISYLVSDTVDGVIYIFLYRPVSAHFGYWHIPFPLPHFYRDFQVKEQSYLI